MYMDIYVHVFTYISYACTYIDQDRRQMIDRQIKDRSREKYMEREYTFKSKLVRPQSFFKSLLSSCLIWPIHQTLRHAVRVCRYTRFYVGRSVVQETTWTLSATENTQQIHELCLSCFLCLLKKDNYFLECVSKGKCIFILESCLYYISKFSFPGRTQSLVSPTFTHKAIRLSVKKLP